MVKDIFHGKIISINETSFKYRLLSIKNTTFPQRFSNLLKQLEKSYKNEPYDYGCIVLAIEGILKDEEFIKNKKDFAKIIGVKHYETVCRIEKGSGCPKGKRKSTLEMAYKRLSEYLENTIMKSLSSDKKIS